MKITSTKIVKVPNRENGLKAFADIIFDGIFCVHGLRVIETSSGKMIVTMPSRKVNDEWKDIAHPITKEFREEIINTVLEEYKKAEEVAEKPEEAEKSEETEKPEADEKTEEVEKTEETAE